MEFEWNEKKRQEVFSERRVDILRAALIFEGPTFTKKDDRQDYSEDRWISIGDVDGECFVVVYTYRGSAIRLITAWKGGRNDRKKYQEGIAG